MATILSFPVAPRRASEEAGAAASGADAPAARKGEAEIYIFSGAKRRKAERQRLRRRAARPERRLRLAAVDGASLAI